jgi:ATP-dependent Lhr-like helicase
VILLDGRPAAFVERGGRRVLDFSDDPQEQTAVADALAALCRRLRRRVVTTVDGAPAEASRLAGALAAAGFVPSYRGMSLRRP